VIWLPVSATECFNPRPSQPEGATVCVVLWAVVVSVSIHAPPNRKERPLLSARELCVNSFQSTPLPTGRSDVPHQLARS